MPQQRFSICNETFAPLGSPDPWPFERICEFLKETGYDGVELAPFTFGANVLEVTARQRGEIRRAAVRSGITICALHWLLITPPGLHIHTKDEAVFDQTDDYLYNLIEFASEVNSPVIVLGSPKARTLEEGDYEGAWARTKEMLSLQREALEHFNVTLCPEALPAPECDFLKTQAEIAKLCDEINHPNIQMMLDVKSMCSEEAGPAELIRQYGSRAVHLHANDANRRGPGSGNTDFKAIADATKESGFDGWVSIEVFDYSQGAEEIARSGLNHLKTCWGV